MTRARETSENARLAKAWVNFNGAFGTSPFTEANGGIRSSFNVSSVTDNGAADYTINFATTLPNANFAASIVAGFSSAVPTFGAESALIKTCAASSVRFVLNRIDGVAIDREIVNVIIFGD
jgi:hypothetical protein